MKLTKYILAAVAIVFAAVLAFMLAGVIFNLLWYVLIFGVLGAGVFVVYKLFSGTDTPQIEENRLPLLHSQTIEQDMIKTDRLLEEYKNKLSNEK
ncbi:MAG TPA: hypothetical protein VEX64_11360 [Pyrinomonadaceae bacterium]|jgi:hypothetical protein|nr:hypothetical protein [Pyrinomonadaceae bacterium]